MIHIDTADMRALERNQERAYNVQHGGAMNAIFEVTQDRALDGQVLRFNTAFPYRDDMVLFRPGSFGDLTNEAVGCRIDHIDSSEVANTDGDAFSVMVDD